MRPCVVPHPRAWHGAKVAEAQPGLMMLAGGAVIAGNMINLKDCTAVAAAPVAAAAVASIFIQAAAGMHGRHGCASGPCGASN